MQASITGKTSLHEGGRLNLYHNWRDYNDLKWNKDGHIDYSRSVLNEYEDWKGNKLTGIVPCQENVNLAPEPLDFFEAAVPSALPDINFETAVFGGFKNSKHRTLSDKVPIFQKIMLVRGHP